MRRNKMIGPLLENRYVSDLAAFLSKYTRRWQGRDNYKPIQTELLLSCAPSAI